MVSLLMMRVAIDTPLTSPPLSIPPLREEDED